MAGVPLQKADRVGRTVLRRDAQAHEAPQPLPGSLARGANAMPGAPGGVGAGKRPGGQSLIPTPTTPSLSFRQVIRLSSAGSPRLRHRASVTRWRRASTRFFPPRPRASPVATRVSARGRQSPRIGSNCHAGLRPRWGQTSDSTEPVTRIVAGWPHVPGDSIPEPELERNAGSGPSSGAPSSVGGPGADFGSQVEPSVR
jgi:hypothetical protein